MAVEGVIIVLIGFMLLIVSVLSCIALGKYISGGSGKAGKRGEVIYMLRVDSVGNIKIRKHRGNITTWQDWSNTND